MISQEPFPPTLYTIDIAEIFDLIELCSYCRAFLVVLTREIFFSKFIRVLPVTKSVYSVEVHKWSISSLSLKSSEETHQFGTFI